MYKLLRIKKNILMKFNIGITGTGSLIGQGIIKSIRNSDYSGNYDLIGFDYFEDTVGSFWCKRNYILPDFFKKEASEEEWISELCQKILHEKLDLLFVGLDFELLVLSENKKHIEKITSCKIIVSSPELIKIGNDKFLTYEFLKNNNLNYPLTFLPGECDLDKLTWPMIIKPRVGARSRGVYKVENKQELLDKIKFIDNPIIQEHVGNEFTEYTCGVIFLDGELKYRIALKRSLKNGNTYISEHRNDFNKNIYEYIDKIANILKPYGSCNLQLRIDEKGVPKLFEINPRHSGTTYIRSLFGYQEIICILKSVLENENINFQLNYGKAMRYFEENLITKN